MRARRRLRSSNSPEGRYFFTKRRRRDSRVAPGLLSGPGLTTSTGLGFINWLILVGCVLLALGLASAHVRRLPISTSLLYLLLGLALGPKGLGWLSLSFRPDNAWFERLTEVAVIVALFLSGMKLRLPLRHRAWAACLRLAGPVMLVCIVAVAALGHFALGMPPAYALLSARCWRQPIRSSPARRAATMPLTKIACVRAFGRGGSERRHRIPFVVSRSRGWSRTGGGLASKWALLDVLWAARRACAGIFHGQRSVAGYRDRSTTATRKPRRLHAMSLIALPYAAAESFTPGVLAVFAAASASAAELAVLESSPHPHAPGGERQSPSVEHWLAHVDQTDLTQQPWPPACCSQKPSRSAEPRSASSS